MSPDWSTESYAATVREHFGEGADLGQPPFVQFSRGVQRIVSRHVRNGLELEGAAVLLLARCPDMLLEDSESMWAIDTGEVQIGGAVWFLGPASSAGRRLAHEFGSDFNSLLRYVVEELGLGEVPAALAFPGQNSTLLRLFEDGFANGDHFNDVEVDRAGVSLEFVFSVLDRLHSEKLVTPSAQPSGNRLWKDPQSWTPVRTAESAVQSYVETALCGALWDCRVKAEDPGIAGRLDVAVWGRVGDDAVRCYVVLELKVLRAFTSGGKAIGPGIIANWVSEGVGQAHAYAEERSAREWALCCYDMRKVDTGQACFDHVVERATGLSVELRAWHLFGREEDFRAHRAELALGGSGAEDHE